MRTDPDPTPSVRGFVPVDSATVVGEAKIRPLGEPENVLGADAVAADAPAPFVMEPDPASGDQTSLFGDAES